MKYTKLLYAIFALAISLSFKSDESLNIVESFIQDISGNTYNSESLITKYFYLTDNDEKLKFLKFQITSIHEQLYGANVQIERYSAIPIADQNIILDNKAKSDIFRVTGNGKLITFIKLEKGKIVSLSTIKKGKHRVFVRICD
jgi:hypothetical protein